MNTVTRRFWPIIGLVVAVLVAGCASRNPGTAKLQSNEPPHDFVVQVNQEVFVLRLVDPKSVSLARSRVSGATPQGIISGKLADTDGGFNVDPNSQKSWSWHLIPETVNFPQLSMEVCDGRPSDVENNKQHWLIDVKMYCPWQAKIIRELSVSGSEP
jgi:hypothetical protein